MSQIVLPSRGEDLLSIIEKAGKPLSRSEIANKLGIKRLTAADDALLETMSLNGLIKADRIEHHGPIGYQIIYSSINVAGTDKRAYVSD